MANRQRDYQAEYRARLARAESRGQTVKQARGHGGDILNRTPLPPQSSAIYTTERGVKDYIRRLGAGRRVKLVAIFEDGGSVVIRGKKGGVRRGALQDDDALAGMEERRQRYRRQGQQPPGRSRLIGYQVIWQ